MKSLAFGAILFGVMTLLYCLLDSNDPQLKDLEFRTLAVLCSCLVLMMSAVAIEGCYDPDDEWEPN